VEDVIVFCKLLWAPGFSTVWGVFVLEILKKLVVVVNLKVVTSSMHFISQMVLFAFIGGNTSIKCNFSNIYEENVRYRKFNWGKREQSLT